VDPNRREALISAAVERVGGPDAVRDAMLPQQRADGTTLKWSAVCCDRAFGTDVSDPVFSGWLRLACTPVREIKAAVTPPGEDRGGRRRGGRQDGPRRGFDRPNDRGSREDIANYGSDGPLRTRLHIPGLS
jgi:hypothetical protein